MTMLVQAKWPYLKVLKLRQLEIDAVSVAVLATCSWSSLQELKLLGCDICECTGARTPPAMISCMSTNTTPE